MSDLGNIAAAFGSLTTTVNLVKDNEPLMTFHPDGRVTVRDGLEPDEGARAIIDLLVGRNWRTPDWRPIAEAPRDGTVVLAWCGHHSLAMWDALHDHWMGSTAGDIYSHVDPTHFMPLPAGPSSLRLDPHK